MAEVSVFKPHTITNFWSQLQPTNFRPQFILPTGHCKLLTCYLDGKVLPTKGFEKRTIYVKEKHGLVFSKFRSHVTKL